MTMQTAEASRLANPTLVNWRGGKRRLTTCGRVVGMAVILLAIAAASASPCRGQDLEPRAYAASPEGAFFVVVGLGRSTGSVITDPTLPVQNVEAAIYAVPLGVGYTFNLLGKLALVTAAVPLSRGDVSGEVGEETRSVSRSGLVDMRAKFSLNLRGNPPMPARAFAVSPRKVIVGTSLTMVAPTGQYKGTQLINLGNHRWAFKPELGVSVPKGRWDIDAYAGVWLFTDNDDFYPGGRERTQEAVVALQAHTSYTVRPRLWLAFDATWYHGGAAEVVGAAPTGGMNNTRMGATLSLPLARSQSIKVAYSSGVAVRTGTNFRTLSVGWQWLRLTKF